MLTNFNKTIFTISTVAVLICSQAYAIPPGRSTRVRIEHELKGEYGRVSDKITPWNIQKNITSISHIYVSQIQNANTFYDYIIYPTSDTYGELSDAYLHVSQYDQAKGLPVQINYPDQIQRNAYAEREQYAQRYSLIERGIKDAVVRILEGHGPKVRIALGSFYNPVYFSDESAVAFYTLSGVHEALQEYKGTQKTKISVFTDGNVKLAQSMDHFSKYFKMAQQTVDKGLHQEMPRMFDVEFKVATKVDLALETEFFAKHIDRFADMGFYKNDGVKMSRFDVMEMLVSDSDYKIAPQRVMNSFRNTLKQVFAGNPNAMIRARIHKIALEKFESEEKATEVTNELMKDIKADLNFSRLGIYSTIMDEKTTDLETIKKSIERAIKK